jgi:hypothetical protein
MDEKELLRIIENYKESPNKDLVKIMSFISNEFEITKKNIIELTHHLDYLETSYNKILKEYESRK